MGEWLMNAALHGAALHGAALHAFAAFWIRGNAQVVTDLKSCNTTLMPFPPRIP